MRKATFWIAAIIALATFLRVLGLWHDYPYSFYGDEAHFVKRALSFGSFDFNPHWFHKPAFYMYLLFFEYGLYFTIGKIIGLWGNISDFAVSYIVNPGQFYIIGRVTTMFFGVATVYMVYLLGEKHFRKNTGLIGAAILALAYGHVVASQDIKADVPTVFFTITSIFFLLNYLSSSKFKELALCAIFAGIGAATKYYPIVMLCPLLLVPFFATNSKIPCPHKKIPTLFLKIIAAFVIFWFSYFICAPYNFLDPLGRKETFDVFIRIIDKIIGFWSHTSTDIPLGTLQKMSLRDGISNYFIVLFSTKGMGPINTLTSTIGVGAMILMPSKKNYFFLLFPLLFVGVSIFTFPGYAEPRHQLPAYPFLAIASGLIIAWSIDKFQKQKKTIIIICVLSLAWPLSLIVKNGVKQSKEDTRNSARIWITNNIKENSKILLDENGPQLLYSEKNILEMLKIAESENYSPQFTTNYDSYLKYQLIAAKSNLTYDITEIRFPWWHTAEIKTGVTTLDSKEDSDMGNPLKKVGVHPYQFYVENDYQYAIVHSYKYANYFKPNSSNITNFPSFATFYKDLFAKGKLIKEFSPKDSNRPGPTVKIFKFQ